MPAPPNGAPPSRRALEEGLAARSKTVAALYERRRNRAFWPDFGGHRPPLQPHLEFLNGLLTSAIGKLAEYRLDEAAGALFVASGQGASEVGHGVAADEVEGR